MPNNYFWNEKIITQAAFISRHILCLMIVKLKRRWSNHCEWHTSCQLSDNLSNVTFDNKIVLPVFFPLSDQTTNLPYGAMLEGYICKEKKQQQKQQQKTQTGRDVTSEWRRQIIHGDRESFLANTSMIFVTHTFLRGEKTWSNPECIGFVYNSWNIHPWE